MVNDTIIPASHAIVVTSLEDVYYRHRLSTSRLSPRRIQ